VYYTFLYLKRESFEKNETRQYESRRKFSPLLCVNQIVFPCTNLLTNVYCRFRLFWEDLTVRNSNFYYEHDNDSGSVDGFASSLIYLFSIFAVRTKSDGLCDLSLWGSPDCRSWEKDHFKTRSRMSVRLVLHLVSSSKWFGSQFATTKLQRFLRGNIFLYTFTKHP